MINVEYRNFEQLINKSCEQPILIFVSGEWLGSAVLMRTIIQQIEKSIAGELGFYEVKFSTIEEFSKSEFNRLPTVLLVKNKEFKLCHQGIISKSIFKRKILSFLNKSTIN